MTLTDNIANGIYHTTKSYHDEVARLLRDVVDSGVFVSMETLDETLNSGGYKDKELVCVGPPEIEFERNSNDPSDVLVRYKFTVDIYAEMGRDEDAELLPEPTERVYGILDNVLPVLVHSYVHGYQLLIDGAVPVSRSEFTQKQFSVTCFIEKQTEFQPCR